MSEDIFKNLAGEITNTFGSDSEFSLDKDKHSYDTPVWILHINHTKGGFHLTLHHENRNVVICLATLVLTELQEAQERWEACKEIDEENDRDS